MKKSILILLSLAALFACTLEEFGGPEEQTIRFRVSAGSDALPTKTLYSGVTYEVETGVWKERINWSAADQVSIYCPEAAVDKVATFSIDGAAASTDEQGPASGITSVNGHLQWSSSSTYNFYARYPDPSWDGASPHSYSAFSSQAVNNTSFLCYLPATQVVTQVGSTSTYLPDMGYCYMTAVTTGVAKKADDITLNFNPAVTALEISIPNSYSNEDFTVTNLKLVSAAHRLNGEYSMNIATGAATVSEASLTEADRTVTVSFGGNITVAGGGTLKFTVFV